MAEYKGVPLSQPQVTTSEEEEGSRSSGGRSENRLGEPGKKPRGRPPGSKNKPKPPIVITRDSESAMRPFVLELSAGCDVIESVSQFAQTRHVGLCVLSGSGTVANVTLRHPSSHSSTLALHGRFDILSLSGTFLPSSTSSVSTVKSSPFTISVAGAQGQVIGGIVAGTLLAAGPILVIAATFMNPSVHRLPEEDSAAGDDMKPPAPVPATGGDGCNNNNNMSMSVYSVASPTPLNTQIQPDHLNWPHTSRPPHF